MPNYGVCKALGGQVPKVPDNWPADLPKPPPLEANPDCKCENAMQAFFCSTGHMMECHYPMSCEQAKCSHLSRYQETEPPDDKLFL